MTSMSKEKNLYFSAGMIYSGLAVLGIKFEILHVGEGTRSLTQLTCVESLCSQHLTRRQHARRIEMLLCVARAHRDTLQSQSELFGEDGAKFAKMWVFSHCTHSFSHQSSSIYIQRFLSHAACRCAQTIAPYTLSVQLTKCTSVQLTKCTHICTCGKRIYSTFLHHFHAFCVCQSGWWIKASRSKQWQRISMQHWEKKCRI